MVDALQGISKDHLSRLEASFGGELITPDHASYDDARRLWSGLFDKRPALLARPTSNADVAAAIRFGREHGLEIAVRGGGHSATGHSSTDDGLVIDLTALRDVTVDPERRTARVGGGALLGQLDVAAMAHGLVVPVGVIGHTGVGGLTLGGGIGRLQRRFGLTIDSLRAIELVTADGRTIRSSETEEPELFWGIRGAGWNFGVVTAFEFALHEFSGVLHRGVRIYPASHVHELWATFRDYTADAPDAISTILTIARAEPASDYPDSVAGGPIVIVGYNHSGDANVVERDIAPLRAGPKPASVTGGSQPYLEVQTAHDNLMGFGGRSFIRSGYANDVSAATLDALVEHATHPRGEGSISITAQGGAITRLPDEATAFAGRSAGFDVSADTAWSDPAEDDACAAWTRAAMAIVEPDSVPGGYLNGQSDAGSELTEASYGVRNLARLRDLKRAWDPDNVFHLNHNIAP